IDVGHRDRALTGLAVIDGDDAAPVDAPGHLVLVLASGHAGVAFDATVSVAEKFHPCHDAVSLSCPNLTEGGLGLLHAGDRIEAVGGDAVDAFAEHHGIGALWIVAALVDAVEPAREVERTPGDALAETLGDERLHAGFRVVLGTC